MFGRHVRAQGAYFGGQAVVCGGHPHGLGLDVSDSDEASDPGIDGEFRHGLRIGQFEVALIEGTEARCEG
jgi:hypothetical protein